MTKRIPIGEICDIYDGPHATPKKTKTGPVYLGIDAITSDGKLNSDNYNYLSEEDYKRWTKRVTPQENDIVFSYEATLGRYAIIPKDFYGCLGRRLAIIRIKSDNINVKWLYYYFKSPEWNSFIESKIVKGSTVNRISIEDFPSFTIPCVDLKTQNKIAHTLSLIEEKIELNKKINDNLEQMAREKYLHMFYDKNPNSRLGNIIKEQPKSKIKVGDAKGKNGQVPFFTSGDTILNWNDTMVSGRNCFLNTGGNADVKFYIGDAAYSTDTWCISSYEKLSDYLYLLLDSIKIELNLKYFQGTGLKHLQKPLLKERMIYLPSDRELDEFNTDVKPWLLMMSANYREIQRLTDTRDWLLPLLMNGQATISD